MFTNKLVFTYFITLILIFNSGWVESVVLYNSFGASVAVMLGNLWIFDHSTDLFFAYKVIVLIFGFVIGSAANGAIIKTPAMLYLKIILNP